jgi:phage terminase large subunit-like protein
MRYHDDMIKAGRIRHNGDPVLAWAISNVIGRMNRKDQVYPDKESREKKIDPVVALLMAFARAIGGEPLPVGPGIMTWS